MGDGLRLYGLNAVVTNAADGIGEAVARTLAKHGARVLAADVDVSGVEQHFRAVKGVEGLFADMHEPHRQAALIDAAVKRLGGLDILVCDYPVRAESPVTAADDALEDLLRQRAEVTLAACRAALPHLRKSPAGRIVTVGLVRSLFAVEARDAVRRAERNLADITRALAVETGAYGITANYVQPGGIMTPLARKIFRKHKVLRDYCIANSAAHRLGEPVDVAKVVLFLASDDAVFVSGTGIAVDGGWSDV
ncbi:MAG TPA: SDR family oxidoreductase [Woeseiaceae bacterium]|nr:SDR family oxidoreductase [Woeseiaceae bacterium]